MLDIDVEEKDNLILSFSGVFDISEKSRVEDLMFSALSNDPKGIIFDLTSVSILDSSAIGLLIACHTRFGKTDTVMAIVLGSDNYLTKKLSYLGIFNNSGIVLFDTIEEAKASLK